MNSNLREAWSPSAVFSPSQARQQLLQAKDWSYVDTWLTTHFHPAPVPPFERTPEVLKALLLLASANETANEELELTRRLKTQALSELKARDAALISHAQQTGDDSPLAGVADHLTPEGQLSLESMALLSVALGTNTVNAKKMATSLLTLTQAESALALTSSSITTLHEKLQAQLTSLRRLLENLNGSSWKVNSELAGKTMEWSHTIRHLQQKSVEYKGRVEQLEREYNASSASHLSIPSLIAQERSILQLKEHVLTLESQVKGFQGLPPEKDLARLEVERMEKVLTELEAKRERLYDGMIGN